MRAWAETLAACLLCTAHSARVVVVVEVTDEEEKGFMLTICSLVVNLVKGRKWIPYLWRINTTKNIINIATGLM